ncbi:hypothetical protein JHK87_004423 [Glycine soja]|nr:hypothetical protein JHK87_004423 [Glycine soja]
MAKVVCLCDEILDSTVTNQNVNQKLIDLFQLQKPIYFQLKWSDHENSPITDAGLHILGTKEAVLFTELYASETRKLVERLINYVIYKIPLGVILAILDLALIALSKSAPALIAGNSFVLKPPTQTLVGFLQADANRVSLFCKPYQFRDCSGCFSLWKSVYANNIGVHGVVDDVQWRVEAPEEEFGHNDGDAGGFDKRGEKRVE